MKKKKIRRGDIYYADLDPVTGSEQGGVRPVIIVQNNLGNAHSPTVVVVPITSQMEKYRLPTHVFIPKSCGLAKKSFAMVEQIRTIDRSRLSNYVGHIGREIQFTISAAMDICVEAMKSRPPKGEMFVMTLCSSCAVDFRRSGYLLVKKGLQERQKDCGYCKTAKGETFGIFYTDWGY